MVTSATLIQWGKNAAVNAGTFFVLEMANIPSSLIPPQTNPIVTSCILGATAAFTSDVADGILLGAANSQVLSGNWTGIADAAAYDALAYNVFNMLGLDQMIQDIIANSFGSLVGNENIVEACVKGVLLTTITLLRQVIASWGGSGLYVANPISAIRTLL